MTLRLPRPVFRKWLGVGLLFILARTGLTLLSPVQAGCTGGGGTVMVKVLSPIAVLHSAQVGQPLTPWMPATKPGLYTCALGSGTHPATGIGFQLTSGLSRSNLTVPRSTGLNYTVWNTGVPGIGIAIGVFAILDSRCGAGAWRDLGTPNTNFPGSWAGDACAVPGTAAGSAQTGGTIEVALIKTGPIKTNRFGGAAVQATSMEQASANAPFAAGPASVTTFTIPPIDITAPTCSTFASDVTLPTVSNTTLRFPGSVAGLTRFAITLVCPAFDPVRVFMTFTDSAAPDNRSKDLTLAPDSTASGVAIRLRHDGADIAYGADSDIVGDPNQFAVTTVDNFGTYLDVPFTASYVRTGASAVTAGTVHAAATYTMAYQ